MRPASRVSIDRVIVHGGHLDSGDVTRLPTAIRAALRGSGRELGDATGGAVGVDAIAAAVAQAVHAETRDRRGAR